MDPALSKRIAERAYQRFLERGGAHGHDREDWLASEAELTRPVDVVLIDQGAREIEVVRWLRNSTGLSLVEVKELIDRRPRPIKRAVPFVEAEAVRRSLELLGARVELRDVARR